MSRLRKQLGAVFNCGWVRLGPGELGGCVPVAAPVGWGPPPLAQALCGLCGSLFLISKVSKLIFKGFKEPV